MEGHAVHALLPARENVLGGQSAQSAAHTPSRHGEEPSQNAPAGHAAAQDRPEGM